MGRASLAKVSVFPRLHRLFTDRLSLPEFRLEWSKARARAARWNEEVTLLREEMRRVLAYLGWKSDDWLQKGRTTIISSLSSCPYQLEGLRAYSCRQANIFADIHNHFLNIWRGLERPPEYPTTTAHPLDSNSDLMELDGDEA